MVCSFRIPPKLELCSQLMARGAPLVIRFPGCRRNPMLPRHQSCRCLRGTRQGTNNSYRTDRHVSPQKRWTDASRFAVRVRARWRNATSSGVCKAWGNREGKKRKCLFSLTSVSYSTAPLSSRWQRGTRRPGLPERHWEPVGPTSNGGEQTGAHLDPRFSRPNRFAKIWGRGRGDQLN